MAFTGNDSYLDYSRLMSEVALALLGEPSSKHLFAHARSDCCYQGRHCPQPTKCSRGGVEWRYGTNGSLSIDLHKNVYYDHEAGQGGGVLDLIVRDNGGDYRDAVKFVDADGICITADARINWQAPRFGGGRRPASRKRGVSTIESTLFGRKFFVGSTTRQVNRMEAASKPDTRPELSTRNQGDVDARY